MKKVSESERFFASTSKIKVTAPAPWDPRIALFAIMPAFSKTVSMWETKTPAKETPERAEANVKAEAEKAKARAKPRARAKAKEIDKVV
jgi:hypothetical protein